MDVVDIREGFICPMCMKDLGSDIYLQDHFEKAHNSTELERDAFNSLMGLFGKVKKKVGKKEELQDTTKTAEPKGTSGSSSASLRQVTSERDLAAWAAVWETQELGSTKSWTEVFRSMRGAHLNYFQSETTKLLLRLEKLLSPDAPVDANKRKAYERAIVPWAPDADVTICTTCGQTFSLFTRRRHHCRLCGCVMCNPCSHFLTHAHAKKFVDSIHQSDGAEELTSPVVGGGFRRSTSNSSLNSVLGPEGDVHFRVCGDCRTLLERRDRTVAERRDKPVITLLYEKMRLQMEEIEKGLPQYQAVVRSLRAGESQHSAAEASRMRMALVKHYETVELLSKRIAALGSDAENAPPVTPAALQLQKKVLMSTTMFLQRHHVVALDNPPTDAEVAAIRETRLREAQQRVDAERAAVAATTAPRGSPARGRAVPQQTTRDAASAAAPAEGWTPTAAPRVATSPQSAATADPLVLQMNNIRAYLAQARAAQKWDEVQMLETNLRELDSHWRSTR